MKKCPYCGLENEDNAANCGRCCAGLVEPKEDESKHEEVQEEQIHVSRKRIRS